ncbi:MAG: chaperonin GroEL [Caldilineaceae bacterium]|nr:chaperonin GroEL [Caldilineaceae bacterium]HRJ44064.1 chaperonin GroEL [Caldilineaceae bacterium]
MPPSRILFGAQAQSALRRGFDQLAAALEIALGPKGSLVAVARDNPNRPPELLSDGAEIARRVAGLPNAHEGMGAYLARHIAWQMEENVGDGATTAVVIARHILNEGHRHIAAGHNPMSLRRGLEKGLVVAVEALRGQALPLEKAEQTVALATSIIGDPVLGKYIEEVFDVVGPLGAVEVRKSYARTHDRRYIRGVLWNNGWISSYFTTEPGKAVVEKPYLLFTDRHLSSADDLIPLMGAIRKEGGRGLVVIATDVTGDALNLLVTNKQRGGLPTLAVKAPGLGTEKAEVLADLAALCGGKVFLEVTGERLAKTTLADLGQADEVQAIRSSFTIVGGRGRPAAIRERADDLRKRIPAAPYGRERERLIERQSKLTGGVAVLEIGGASDVEQEYLDARTEEAIRVVRLALQEGIVPGGGAAYLACIPAVEKLALSSDEAPAIPILCRALEAPARAIISNAGVEPAPILARLSERGPGWGYDVLRHAIVEMATSHIVDPAKVAEAALTTGVSGALMGLTTDVLVYKPRHNRDEDVDFEA